MKEHAAFLKALRQVVACATTEEARRIAAQRFKKTLRGLDPAVRIALRYQVAQVLVAFGVTSLRNALLDEMARYLRHRLFRSREQLKGLSPDSAEYGRLGFDAQKLRAKLRLVRLARDLDLSVEAVGHAVNIRWRWEPENE